MSDQQKQPDNPRCRLCLYALVIGFVALILERTGSLAGLPTFLGGILLFIGGAGAVIGLSLSMFHMHHAPRLRNYQTSALRTGALVVGIIVLVLTLGG